MCVCVQQHAKHREAPPECPNCGTRNVFAVHLIEASSFPPQSRTISVWRTKIALSPCGIFTLGIVILDTLLPVNFPIYFSWLTVLLNCLYKVCGSFLVLLLCISAKFALFTFFWWDNNTLVSNERKMQRSASKQ